LNRSIEFKGANWTCIQTYLVSFSCFSSIVRGSYEFMRKVDSYAIHAASAIAGVSSFRAFAGFGFPLFADEMYAQLGDGAFLLTYQVVKNLLHGCFTGWGNSILALICLVIGCPAPFVFYRYGARLRARSRGSSVE
jgi:hypothetical protein